MHNFIILATARNYYSGYIVRISAYTKDGKLYDGRLLFEKDIANIPLFKLSVTYWVSPTKNDLIYKISVDSRGSCFSTQLLGLIKIIQNDIFLWHKTLYEKGLKLSKNELDNLCQRRLNEYQSMSNTEISYEAWSFYQKQVIDMIKNQLLILESKEKIGEFLELKDWITKFFEGVTVNGFFQQIRIIKEFEEEFLLS